MFIGLINDYLKQNISFMFWFNNHKKSENKIYKILI